MKEMAEKISGSRKMSMISWWWQFGGPQLVNLVNQPADDPWLAWDRIKALVLLSSEIVANLSSKEAVARFRKKSGLSSLFARKADMLQELIVKDFSGATAHVKDFHTVPIGKLSRERLLRAPMWNMDVIAPTVFENVEVARVVYHHKALRKLLKESVKAKAGASLVPNSFLARVAWMHPRELVRASFAENLSVWTNTFLRKTARSDLFTKRASAWAINPRFESAGLPIYRAVGRVLGVMFARGVKSVKVNFEQSFCLYLVDEDPDLNSIAKDYPLEFAFLKHMSTNSWDIEEFLEARAKIAWENLDKDEVQKMKDREESLRAVTFWINNDREKAGYVAWVEVMIRQYTVKRIGPGFQEMKAGFWEVVPLRDEKISGPLLAKILTSEILSIVTAS